MKRVYPGWIKPTNFLLFLLLGCFHLACVTIGERPVSRVLESDENFALICEVNQLRYLNILNAKEKAKEMFASYTTEKIECTQEYDTLGGKSTSYWICFFWINKI